MSVTIPGRGIISSRGTVWYQGRWRSPEGIARKLATRTDNARRVFVGRYYVGMAPTEEIASTLNNETREHFAQKEVT